MKKVRKILFLIYIIAITVFAVDWTVIGILLLRGNYEITAGAYVGLVCLIIMFAYLIYRVLSNRCPYCKKYTPSDGRYCPHCGREIKNSIR